MTALVDLEASHVEQLARELESRLRVHGVIGAVIADLDSVDRWRRAARGAARRLGWRIRTGMSHDGLMVWARSDDFEVKPSEVRAAAERLTWLLVNGDDPPA